MESRTLALRNGVAVIRRTFRTLPWLMRAGLALASLGAAIDIVYHLGAGTRGAGHGAVAFTGHVVTLIGMVITMLGLLGAAFMRRPINSVTKSKGENR